MIPRKPISPRQAQANRQNARKSTGPKTAAGKAASARNAVTHGLLAREVVVHGHQIHESDQEFQALYQRFRDSYQPVGPVEELLVDRIVATHWRLRRVLVAERGEIALNVDEGHWQRSHPSPLPVLIALVDPGPINHLTKLEQSMVGLNYLICVLREIQGRIQADNRLTKETYRFLLDKFAGQPNRLTKQIEKFSGLSVDTAEEGAEDDAEHAGDDVPEPPAAVEQVEPAAAEAKIAQQVLDFIDGELCRYQQERDVFANYEEQKDASKQAAALLLEPDVLDRILRYETALERQLYHAMNQLERLQRQRNGEQIPPPLAVEVAHRA